MFCGTAINQWALWTYIFLFTYAGIVQTNLLSPLQIDFLTGCQKISRLEADGENDQLVEENTIIGFSENAEFCQWVDDDRNEDA